MKLKILIGIAFISIFYWVIGTYVIENDKLKFVKDKIPNYFNWKYIVKKFIFFKDNKKKIIIKSDGSKIFELSEDNNIYIYTDEDEDQKLRINGILKDRKINCLNTSFRKDKIIEINKFNSDCKNAIYYIGIVENKFYKNLYFNFGVKQKEGKSKNLLVFPSTAFYNYNSNIYNLNVYTTKNSEYVSNLSEIPLNTSANYIHKVGKSIHNLKSVFNDFDIINDYNIENVSLENYDLIILPLHQEYYSKRFFDKLLNFIKSKEKNILSIGASNFSREIYFKENSIIYKNYDNWKIGDVYNQISLGLNFFYDTDKDNFNLSCTFVNDKDLALGYIARPVITDNIDYFFYDINCDDNIEIPLLGSQTFFKDGGKFIQILPDGIGLNFDKIDYLKSEILNQLN
ncbi:MAG: hypothetical protein ACJZ4O_01910 [Pelagibacteraceae bacterium]